MVESPVSTAAPRPAGVPAPGACSLCGNNDPANFTFITDRFRYEGKKYAFRCGACQLVFVVPLMSPEEEREFYEREYGVIYSREKGATPQDLFDKRLPDARRDARLCEKHLKKTDDCLEVGCASGYFLHTIRDRVRSVTGFETHTELRAYCETIGIPMLKDLGAAKPASFDKIFIFFVLEHIGDPMGFLGALKRLLKPGGQLLVEVPNVDDALLALYDIPALRDFYFTPAHQFYYSKSTLDRVLRKAGFSAVAIEPEQRYDLSNHMHWMLAGKPGGQGKYNHAFSPELLAAYSQNLKDRYLCDTLFAVARV